MSTRLVILGLLQERPLYGYEIKQLIEEHMGDWTAIAFGSIYFALGKLDEEGFIEKVATEQEGNRPSRSVYRITGAGRDEFQRLLRQVWREMKQQTYDLDIGLFFIDALPPQEVRESLQARIDQLEDVLRHLEAHQAEQMQQPEIPSIAKAIFEHSRVHVRAELSWTKTLLEGLERGSYP